MNRRQRNSPTSSMFKLTWYFMLILKRMVCVNAFTPLLVQQRFGDAGLEVKSHLLKENGDITGPESASKDVGLGEEVALKHRVLYKLELCTLRSYLVRTR